MEFLALFIYQYHSNVYFWIEFVISDNKFEQNCYSQRLEIRDKDNQQQ